MKQMFFVSLLLLIVMAAFAGSAFAVVDMGVGDGVTLHQVDTDGPAVAKADSADLHAFDAAGSAGFDEKETFIERGFSQSYTNGDVALLACSLCREQGALSHAVGRLLAYHEYG